MKKVYVIGALTATLVCVISLWAVLKSFRAPDEHISTSTVTVGPIVRRVVATGTVEPLTTVQVGTQVSGTIRSVEVDYNAIVHAGQVIARLDPTGFEAALREAQGALGAARASEMQARANEDGFHTAVDDAQTQLRRAEQLSADQLIPASDLDTARTAMAEARADLQSGDARVAAAQAGVLQAEAGVAEAKVNLEHTVITSPIDGVVVARNLDVGQTVAATLQSPVLFDIAGDLRHVQIETDVDESDVAEIMPGEPAVFTVEAYPDDVFEGVVSQIRLQPVAQETTTAATVGVGAASTQTTIPTVISYGVFVTVDNTDEKLKPGMTATVTMGGSRREDTIRIPNQALVFRPAATVLRARGQSSNIATDSETPRVWRLDGRQLIPVAVETGLADAEWTELIRGPLKPGDPLVTNITLGNAGPSRP